MPFAADRGRRAAAVMTSHVLVPGPRPDLPATLSAPILGLLRDRLGFAGVIVSDALDMAGASALRGIPEAAVVSIAAGADLLCIGRRNSVEQVRSIQAALVDAVPAGRARREQRLAEASDAVGRFADRLRRPVDASRGATDESVVAAGARVGDCVGTLPPWRERAWYGSTPRDHRDRRRPLGLPADLVVAPGRRLRRGRS